MSPVVPRFGRVGQQTGAGLGWAGSDIGHSFELVAAASLHLHLDHLEKGRRLSTGDPAAEMKA